jgi:FAD synthase
MTKQEIQQHLKKGDIREAAEMLGMSYYAAQKAWQRESSKDHDLILSALNIIITQRLKRQKIKEYEKQ